MAQDFWSVGHMAKFVTARTVRVVSNVSVSPTTSSLTHDILLQPVHARMRVHTRVCTCPCMLACTRTCLHACMHACTYTGMYARQAYDCPEQCKLPYGGMTSQCSKLCAARYGLPLPVIQPLSCQVFPMVKVRSPAAWGTVPPLLKVRSPHCLAYGPSLLNIRSPHGS